MLMENDGFQQRQKEGSRWKPLQGGWEREREVQCHEKGKGKWTLSPWKSGFADILLFEV